MEHTDAETQGGNERITFTVGAELFNPAKGMGLGVITDVSAETISTESVSGQEITRPREQVETMLRTSSMEQRETPDWFSA